MMSLLDKLFSSRKSFKSISVESDTIPYTRTQNDDRNSVLSIGTEQVRILLFRECEWRGRKLLFDSVTLERCRNRKESATCNVIKNNSMEKDELTSNNTNGPDSEVEKTAEDDVSLLSEMVFGTVAMTYRGPSFKVHSMKYPAGIMCTKVFPVSEHNTCKQSGRFSDEALGRSLTADSNSSIASARTLFSRPSSGNLSGNDVSSGPRKNSTCSSIGSGWDIEIPPPASSSQSLDSSGSSGFGSLSSLRRRWLRVMSTSLSRSDSDDAFGMQQWGENSSDIRDSHHKRHKTRLGLAVLLRLPCGHERQVEARVLEHMALVEGMLDRLRFFCTETANVNGQTNIKGMLLAERLYRAASRFIVSLLRVLVYVGNSPAPLLWHDILLNSMITVDVRINTIHHSFQDMCQLLNDIDTKSSNFFLSTVVTAVLTYHLGWVYMMLPAEDRQTMEKLGRWYNYNPLWAQLGDLYGALGNPVKVAHTVIAGDSRKVDMINSVLSFLSYFIRSGIVQKRREHRSRTEQDVHEAINALEQARIRQPFLFANTQQRCNYERDNVCTRYESSAQRIRRQPSTSIDTSESRSGSTDGECSTLDYSPTRSNAIESSRLLKRSETIKSNLDVYELKSAGASLNASLNENDNYHGQTDKDSPEKCTKTDESCALSKVKIIVSEIAPQESHAAKNDLSELSQLCVRELKNKTEAEGSDNNRSAEKTSALARYDDSSRDIEKLYSDSSNQESTFLGLNRDLLSEDQKSQVFFTLGAEEKSAKPFPRSREGYTCQCAYTFTRVPSTSAQLPEGVLRKIIQRNFPESSKGMQPPPGTAASLESRSIGFCMKCNGQENSFSDKYDGSKQLLETPTNATEVLRTCSSSVVNRTIVGPSQSNSLESLMEANSVIELPMPRSKRVSVNKMDAKDGTGFTKTLLQNKVANCDTTTNDTCQGYTWGLVMQGLIKKGKKHRRKMKDAENEVDESCRTDSEKKWWWFMKEEVGMAARFPIIDQPIAEALCILADLDTWQVGILSNQSPLQSPPVPVGMSRLVSNMLEAFAYVWRKYHSPVHCLRILEGKLREMWLRSQALAEILMATTDVCDASISSLTTALDLDAADIPLLLAVATTHSPQIAQRYGLTLA